MTVGCSSNSSYAHNDPAHTTRRTEVRLSRVAARAGHDLGHCCCGWARWGLVERECEVAVGSSCPGVKLVEWASKRGASLGVSAADRAGATTNACVAATSPLSYRHCCNAFVTFLAACGTPAHCAQVSCYLGSVFQRVLNCPHVCHTN